MERIKESLLDLYNFKISEGEIVATLKDAEALFGKDYEAIKVMIQKQKPYTPMKQAGEWTARMVLWVFATTKGTQYVIEDTRGKGIPEKVLGEKEDRVIISDG